VPEELWQRIEPLLPVRPRRFRSRGRSRILDGQVPAAVIAWAVGGTTRPRVRRQQWLAENSIESIAGNDHARRDTHDAYQDAVDVLPLMFEPIPQAAAR
jgi:hypothetical protein